MSYKERAKRFLKKRLPLKIYNLIYLIALSLYQSKNKYKSGLRYLFLLRPFTLFGHYPKFLYPEVLSIFLTTRCNLRCFICRRENFTGEDFKFENIYKLKNAIKYASTIDLTGWGECFLYPRFEDVIKYIYSLNQRNNLIQITTNGTLLSKKKARLLRGHLKRLIISLNAAKTDTYNRDMKHGNFERTIQNIKDFMGELDKTGRGKIVMHFVAHTENFREIPDFVTLAKELGIPSISIGNYMVDIKEHRQFTLLNVKDEYNAVIDDAKRLSEELGVQLYARRFYNEKPGSMYCLDPLISCFIEIDGQVGPCCYCGSYRLGNVYETSFESVWFSKEYNKLRKKRYLPACKKCTPFIPFDDPKAHFTAYFKEKEDFKEFVKELEKSAETDKQRVSV